VVGQGGAREDARERGNPIWGSWAAEAPRARRSAVRQMVERGKSVAACTVGHRSQTLGWGGPVHPEKPPGRSGLDRDGWSSAGDIEPLEKEVAIRERCMARLEMEEGFGGRR
jgi:hypothetical protein